MAVPATTSQREALAFHALSDETRLAILARLRDGERCVCELQGLLGASQSRLSFHLRTLKDAGLVSDRKQGRWTYYAIEAGAVDSLIEMISALRPWQAAAGRAGGCC